MRSLRLRRRAAALLNVDETIDKVDASLDRFNEALVEFDEEPPPPEAGTPGHGAGETPA